MTGAIRGSFVLAWAQTRIDGNVFGAITDLINGASWSWEGKPIRIDGPQELLLLGDAQGQDQLRKRAATSIKKLIGAEFDLAHSADASDDPLLQDFAVVLTDGRRSYTMTVIQVSGHTPVVMFVDELPPQGQTLWVVDVQAEVETLVDGPTSTGGGLICFAQSTRIRTAKGATPVDQLNIGDNILTKDNGAQPILWIGQNRISGARLQVLPEMRPIRINAHAFHADLPQQDLLVSPDHRMLVQGRVALDLFNSDEVLVAARDLINGRSIYPERRLKEVVYYHILLPQHDVIWANDVESESFQPGQMDFNQLADAQQADLYDIAPSLAADRHSWGADARRSLTRGEAAIFNQVANTR